MYHSHFIGYKMRTEKPATLLEVTHSTDQTWGCLTLTHDSFCTTLYCLPVKLTCSNVGKHRCWVPWWLAIDLSVVSQDLSCGLQAPLIWKCPPKCMKISQSLRDFLQSQTSTRLSLCRHATLLLRGVFLLQRCFLSTCCNRMTMFGIGNKALN